MAWKKLVLMTIAVMAISSAMLIQNVAAQTQVPQVDGQTTILEDCGAETSGALIFTGASASGLVPNEESNQESLTFTNNGNVNVVSLEVEAPINWAGVPIPPGTPANVMLAGTLHVDDQAGTDYATKLPVPLAPATALDLGGITAFGGTLITYWILQAILEFAHAGDIALPLDFIVTCGTFP